MSINEPQASAALAEAIRRFTDSHPNPCVDCLTRVYQAGVLDAADAANAEVQRLTAELALKDQALDEIAALAQALPSAGFRTIDDDYERGSRHAKDDLKREIQRILTRLDTQGETK